MKATLEKTLIPSKKSCKTIHFNLFRFYISLVFFSKLPRIVSFFSEVRQGSTTKHVSMLASPSIDKKLGVDFRVSMNNIYVIHHRITHMTETHAVQFRML